MYEDNEILKKLRDFGFEIKVVEHPPAITTELADKFIEGHEGVRTKSMFLTNKKKTEFYLLVMDDRKRLDMDKLKDIVGANRIKMASEETLQDKLKLSAGVVSPFGLLNNKEHDIRVYFDEEILREKIQTFHPNTNEMTIFIKTDDLLKFLDKIGFSFEIINL